MANRCSVHETAKFVGKKWTILVLLELHKESGGWKRYSAIKQGIGKITPKMLSKRLSELCELGLVKNRVDAEKNPIVSEYKLTASGKAFMKVIEEMRVWAENCLGSGKSCIGSCEYCERVITNS